MIGDKRVLAITLARGGSKSIKNKNIKPINGVPLIGYTFNEVVKSNYIDRYILSTDSLEIAKYANLRNVDVPFLRPPELAEDTSTSSDALIHAVKYLEDSGDKYDYIVELMATNPLKEVIDIDSCIEILHENESVVNYVVACHQIYDHHPSRVKYLEDGILRDFYPEVPESRRQDLFPNAYVRSGSIYAMKRDKLLSNCARYDKESTKAYILPSNRVVNIDEPIDLLVAEKILESRDENITCSD